MLMERREIMGTCFLNIIMNKNFPKSILDSESDCLSSAPYFLIMETYLDNFPLILESIAFFFRFYIYLIHKRCCKNAILDYKETFVYHMYFH